MAIKRIDTYGGNPLLMLHKLSDVGGLDILESSSVVRGDTEHYIRVVAKVNDNLYIEAYDPVNALLEPSSERRIIRAITPSSGISESGTGTRPVSYVSLKQELTSEDWATAFPLTGTSSIARYVYGGILAPDLPGLVDGSSGAVTVPFVAFSCFSRMFVGSSGTLDKESGAYSRDVLAFPQNGGRFFTPFGGATGTALMNWNLSSSDSTFNISPASTTHNVGFASTVVTDITLSRPYARYGDSFLYPDVPIIGLYGMKVRTYGSLLGSIYPIFFSGAMIRVATSVNLDTELITPTEWFEFTAHTTAISYEGEGLLFANPGTDAFNTLTTYQYVGSLNTDVGNGFGGGTCPIVTRLHPLTSGLNMGTEPYSRVLGTTQAGYGVKTMTHYAPSIPIGSDVYAGGPVVGNTFVISEDEVRGAFPVFLSCGDSLAVGTMGWLDGKRYRVFKPGMMMRVG